MRIFTRKKIRVVLTPIEHSEFQRNGFTVSRGLFLPEETLVLREHFMKLRDAGSYPGDFDGMDTSNSDPLKRFPRMIHMHRWDTKSMEWMLDNRLNAVLTELMGKEPYAVQTMLYFKPPGARGQAMHQDQLYLRAKPGTCIAAWLALDDCDEENGCMQMIPADLTMPLLCTQKADTSLSFTDVTVPLPPHFKPMPVIMKAGDVLFFHGSVIHGSLPNTSTDRFRRALIGHYITGNAKSVGEYYHPILRMNGAEVKLGLSYGGGPCGVWSERNGNVSIDLIEDSNLSSKAESTLHE